MARKKATSSKAKPEGATARPKKAAPKKQVANSQGELQADPPEVKQDEPGTVTPPAPPAPQADPPEGKRTWKTTAEVSKLLQTDAVTLSRYIADGLIAGMEKGKQGQPQRWEEYHIEVATRIQGLGEWRSYGISDAAVADAVNLDAARMDGKALFLSAKGMRLLSDRMALHLAMRVFPHTAIIVNTSRWRRS